MGSRQLGPLSILPLPFREAVGYTIDLSAQIS